VLLVISISGVRALYRLELYKGMEHELEDYWLFHLLYIDIRVQVKEMVLVYRMLSSTRDEVRWGLEIWEDLLMDCAIVRR